jgi:hypothetical protein
MIPCCLWCGWARPVALFPAGARLVLSAGASLALLAGCGGGGGGTTGPLLVRSTEAIRVGVVDTGFVVSHPEYAEFVENFQVFSAGTATTTNTTTIEDTEDPHGTYVAQVIAGKTTGFVETTGDASLLLAKATPINVSPSVLYTDYVLDTRDILAGTVWAIDRGARVMNYSLAPMYLLNSDLFNTYAYAQSRNVAMVISAGNSSLNLTQDSLSFGSSASLFTYESLRNITLVVGAVQSSGGELVLAPYSNYAGTNTTIQSRFLVAQDPVRVLSQFPLGSSYTNLLAYGTSFTAPQVTAALVSLLVRWPHLSAVDSTQILLDTANRTFSSLYNQNNCGDGGIGTGSTNCGLFYFGQGLLDLDKALAPVGTTSFALGSTVGGSGVSVASTSLALAPAFGNAAAQLQLGTALFDGYGRDYTLNLASRMQAAQGWSGSRNWWSMLGEERQDYEDASSRVHATFSGSGELLGSGGKWSLDGRHALHWQRASGRHYEQGEASAGSAPWLSLAGQGALSSYDWVDGLGVSRTLQGGAEVYAGWSRASFESGGSALADNRSRSDSSALQQQLQLSWGTRATTRWTVGWALTQEREAALGAQGAGGLALSRSFGQSAFARFERGLGDGWNLFGHMEWGTMNVEGTGLLQEMSGVRTSRWSAGLSHSGEAQRWGVALSQPLRVEAAKAVFNLPVGRTVDGAVLRETRTVNLAPTGRQVNLEFALERPWTPAALRGASGAFAAPGASGAFGFHLIHAQDAGHVAGARDWALLGSYRLRW